MKKIKLSVNWKMLYCIFLALFAVGACKTGFEYWGSMDPFLFISILIAAALACTAFITAMIYLSMPAMGLDHEGIYLAGRSSRSLAFEDIRRIEKNPGAVKIVSDDLSLTISNFYTGYAEARAFLEDRLGERCVVTVVENRNRTAYFLFLAFLIAILLV